VALAGLLAAAALLTGCSLVNRILGRTDGDSAATAATAGAGAGAAGGGRAGGGGNWGAQAALPVVTAEVGRETVASFLVATTTLTPDRAIDVVARAGGAVVSVLVQEGDAVREGQLLARLDQDDARLALAEAEAHYENIQSEHARTTELAKHGGATDQELESQRYQIELRTIALERARQGLDDTEVRAPIAGIVAERMVDEGVTISANTRLFHVLDPDPLLAVIHIPDSGRQNLGVGQEVEVHAAGGILAAGTITRISPVVDAESGTVKVTVELRDSGSGALLPGTFVTVQVPTETRPNALVVPKRAILLERDQNIVYRVQEGVAVRTPVAIGLSAHDVVEVTSGLSAGEVVVTIGQESLRDGAAVRAAGEPLPETAAGGQQGGAGGGGFDISQMPAERRAALVQRLLANPEIKKAYDEKLAEDPSLADDEDKRLAFFREQIAAQGGLRAVFGGGGGGQGGARAGAGGAGGGAQQGAAGGGAGRQASADGQQAATADGGQTAAGTQPAAAATAGAGGAGQGAGAGGQRAAGGGPPSLAQLPEDRREAVVQRLLQNAEVKKAYDAKLKEDPLLENDEARRLEFLQEQLQAIGGFRALFGGGGGGGFGN
jgi:membrane fusion protein (multidrug efflux system)